MNWKIKHYNDLSRDEFHDLLLLRVEVFVVEQNCPYQEVDGKDKNSYHLVGRDEEGEMIATARIFPPGIYFEEVTIGRIVVNKANRGKNMGNKVMEESMEFVREKFGEVDVKLAAQAGLEKFYNKHRFVRVSETYLWDDILHIDMLYKS